MIRFEVAVCLNILLCVDIYCLTSSYFLRCYAACTRVERCFTSFCSNIAVGNDITVSNVDSRVVGSINLVQVNITFTNDVQCKVAAFDITLIATSSECIIIVGYTTVLQYVDVYVAMLGSYIAAEGDVADIAFICLRLQVDVASRAVDNIFGNNAAFGIIINILLRINLSAGLNAAAVRLQIYVSVSRSNIAFCSDIFRCFDSYCLISCYVLGIYAAAVRLQIYVSMVRFEVAFCSDILRYFDSYCLISSYVLRRYATCAGVENCFTVLCSNVAVGCNITVSVCNYVIVSLNLSAGRNAAACLQIYVSIGRSQVTVSSDILRCVDIYVVVGSYATGIYVATLGVESCVTGICSNIAVGVDIACLSNNLNITIGSSNTLL